MAYKRQGFYAGQQLKASHLVAMEDGIIEAQTAWPISNGKGIVAIQQRPRPDKIHDHAGLQCFTIPAEMAVLAGLQPEIEYGAIGDYAVSLCARSSAQNKHTCTIGNSTVALGEEAFAQGYASVARGPSSFAGGSLVYTGPLAEAAVAHGVRTIALGKYTFVTGVNTIAGYDYQTVCGILNKNDANNLFEVGGSQAQAKSVFENADEIIGNYYLDNEGALRQINSSELALQIFTDANITEIYAPTNAFAVTRNGKAKVRNGWITDDDDVVNKFALSNALNTTFSQVEELIKPIMTKCHIHQTMVFIYHLVQ